MNNGRGYDYNSRGFKEEDVMHTGRCWDLSTLRKDVLATFKEYGGWWRIEGMAEWLDVPVHHIEEVWDVLEAKGLLERKRTKKRM